MNEIHDHKEDVRPSDELLTDLQGSERSEFYEEEKEPQTSGKHVRLKASRKIVQALSQHSSYKSIPFHKREPLLRMRGHGRLFMHIDQMEDTWQLQSPNWLHKCCVMKAKIKDKLMVQCIGSIVESACTRKRTRFRRTIVVILDS